LRFRRDRINHTYGFVAGDTQPFFSLDAIADNKSAHRSV
jgi:hypothetical protein